MLRCFFHIRSEHSLERDEDGVELADLDAVRVEAQRTIASFIQDAAMTGEPLPGDAFEITDAQGKHLLTVPFDIIMRRRRSA